MVVNGAYNVIDSIFLGQALGDWPIGRYGCESYHDRIYGHIDVVLATAETHLLLCAWAREGASMPRLV